MPDYSLLKILHAIAATLTVIGILMSAFAVAKPQPATKLAAMRKWDLFVTVPALVLVWILGVTLTIEGNWFPSGWLPLKLVFVLGLSALHGMLAGSLKRLQRGQPAPAFLRFAPYLVIVCVVAIVALVETKPF